MNEKLIEEILKIVKSTTEFATAQAPSVVQELLASSAFEHNLWGWVCAGFLALALSFFLIALYQLYETADDIYGLFAVLLFVPVIVLGIAATMNFGTVYQIKHFPKAYLVKQLAREVSK